MKTVVTIEKVDISFFKFFRFENVYLEDHNQDTLAFIKTLDVGLDFFKLKNDTFSLHIGMVELDKPYYNLQQQKGDSLTNIYFVLEPLFSTDTTESNLTISIKTSNLIIKDGRFIWDNHNFEHTKYGINWDHIDIENINAVLTTFEMLNDTFTSTINHLSGKEISGFVLDDFTGEATFSSILTKVDNLHIRTPYSNIYTDLEYDYDSIGSYVNFNYDVYMKYKIDTSVINFKDLSYFAPKFEGLDYPITIYGKERGPVNDMKYNNLFIQYGTESIVKGRVFIHGLPDVENTSFNCKFKQLSTNYTDLKSLKKYPFTENRYFEFPQFLKNAGTIKYVGYFNGFYNNFVTAGSFTSLNGLLTTDLQLTTTSTNDIHYRGSIKTINFDLAEITGNNKLFDKTSFNLFVEGNQLDFETMNLSAKGTASRFDFMGYSYNDIVLDGKIENQTISGLLTIADTNINLEFDGSIALNEEVPEFQFVATIEHLRPQQLHLMKRDSSASLSTKVNFNFKGNSLDNVVGHAGLRDFYFIENGEDVQLKRVDFIALTDGKDKTLALTSDNIDLQITGEYYFGELFQSLNYMTYKWLPTIYTEPQEKPKTTQKFDLDLKAKDFSGFSSIFIPQVSFDKELHVHITYDSELENLQISSESPRMTFAQYNVDTFSLDAQISPDSFNLFSDGKRMYLTDSSFIENFNIKSIASENQISSDITWDNRNKKGNNSGNIEFDLRFIDPENFDIIFYNSWVQINDTAWTFRDSSQIVKQGRSYAFDNVLLSQDYQDLSLNGVISEDPSKQLVIDVDSFNLGFLNHFISKYEIHTEGTMDGSTVIQDFYGDFNLYSKLTFNELVFNHHKIGDGVINSEWIDAEEKFDIDVHFTNDTLKPVTILGNYYPIKKTDKLDLSVVLDQFPVGVLEPFFKDIVSNLKGTLTGKAIVDGSFKEMLFNGDFEINDASVHVDYLNETLFIDKQKIFIKPTLIGADAVIVTDSKNKKAMINFSLFHDNFENMNFDLSVTSIDLFRAFNTKKKDNEYFYGTIYLSPGSSIGMDSDYDGNLRLEANVKSGAGTLVNIPFYDEDEVVQKEYIYFKPTHSDTIDLLKAENKPEISKDEDFTISLNMAMELTKNAEIQLLFDEFTADKIRASGDGIINLKINEAGDFQMFGNYEIDEGYYLFTFWKIVSKKFLIRKGSRLTWNGNPYEGIADIKGTYKVRTALYDLGPVVSAAYSDTSELKKRVPVEVVLTMTGNYMNPELSFSFEMPPKYDEISSLLNGLDEGEKNKQVFSLLILNKFMPISGEGGSTGADALGANGSEVLSNQLSSWLSKISNDFDVGFRYNPGDQISGNEVELALSTQVFNDRVLIETNFGVTSTAKGNTNTSQSSTFIGEVTISYKINEKGNIVGKVFNRSNELNPVYQNVSPYTQGVGIAYSEPFNTWDNLGCIMGNHFRKKENKHDCQEEYYVKQELNKDKNEAEILKTVAKSRKKQKKRNEKKKKRQDKADRRKESNINSNS